MDPMPTDLNVLTLNCWGLKYISKYRRERLSEIGKKIALAEPTPHIVGLQECWTQEDYRSIRESTKHILPYGKFYFSGVFGGGLAILSKWPIEESSMRVYPLNGLPTAFWRGDWYVGKGVASAKIRIGPAKSDVIEVFTTHLHAGYHKEAVDPYVSHRTAQAWEISKIIRGAVDRGHLVLAIGDFNMSPSSLAHQIVSTHGQVRDIWRVLHPNSALTSAESEAQRNREVPIPTIEYNLSENGTTCDTALITWKWNKAHQKRLGPNKPAVEVPLSTPDPRGGRVDYIFANVGAENRGPGGWSVKKAKVGMTDRHPTLQCSLSDHLSVECTFMRDSGFINQKSKKENDKEAEVGTFLKSPTNSEWQQSEEEKDGQGEYHGSQKSFLPVETYDKILAMTEKHTVRERKERRYRLYHFVGSIVVSIGCLVAVWWSPRNFVAFLLMLLSTLGLSSGVIDGLIGGLFIGSEIRALKEFEWEIKTIRATADGSGPVEDTGIQDW